MEHAHQEYEAVVLGGSGLVGNLLLKQLSEQGMTTLAVLRREVESLEHVDQLLISDFSRLRAVLLKKPLGLSNAKAFSALGTTLKDAGSKEKFRHIDHDYNLSFAAAVHDLGCESFNLVSAHGADPDSSVYYNHIKGELEQSVQRIGFETLNLFRPSLLLGQHDERLLESVAVAVMRPFDNLFDKKPLPKVWPIEPSQVAAAMLSVAFDASPSRRRVITNQDMHALKGEPA